MKINARKRPALILSLAGFLAAVIPTQTILAAPRSIPEFPHKNFWAEFTPSVVWCGDPQSTTTLEVHIVGRSDVRKVWVANLAATGDDPPLEPFDDSSKGLLFYDDGTHGDAQSGDNVFTHNGLVLPCNPASLPSSGWDTFWGFVRVELADGTRLGESYGMNAGLVDPAYRSVFAVRDFGNNLSATAYAFFIDDSSHEVIGEYPVSNVYCGTSNYQAYRKLYSVLPDSFDIALITPGMQLFRPKDLKENVPYDLRISNAVQHIGLPVDSRAADFGSAGRLKSAVYHSFGTLSITTHEIGHTWGIYFGRSLGLINTDYGGHWDAMTDIGGQMGMYYFDEGRQEYGHFLYNGDGTWRWNSNLQWEPYSPLELYLMGLIPASEVPPVHILQSPDLSDLTRITAASYKTLTIDQLMQAEGGGRIPSVDQSQKEFNLAFLVTQDRPYDEAAYAFFSLMSYNLMSKAAPDQRTFLSTFYWATGGRATLSSRLPVNLPDPAMPPGLLAPSSTPTAEATQAATADIRQKQTQKAQAIQTAQGDRTPAAPTISGSATKPASGSPLCNCPLIAGGLVLLPGAWAAMRKKRTNP